MSENLNEVDAFLAHYGVKGMRWGKRRGPDVDRDGVNTKHPNYAQNRSAENKKYSREEILNARVNYGRRAQRSLDAIKNAPKRNDGSGYKVLTKEAAKAFKDMDTVDGYIASRKTQGEKAVSALLFGAPGLYYTKDSRTSKRASNASFEKSVKRGQKAAKALGLN